MLTISAELNLHKFLEMISKILTYTCDLRYGRTIGQYDGRAVGRLDGQAVRWSDGWMVGRSDGWTRGNQTAGG